MTRWRGQGWWGASCRRGVRWVPLFGVLITVNDRDKRGDGKNVRQAVDKPPVS